MTHKYNNTVIKVLNKEHGKQVIQWWKEQGVNTYPFTGGNSVEDKYLYYYYGIYNEKFGCYSLNKVEKYNLKVIELPTELPENWFIRGCNELVEYFKKIDNYYTGNLKTIGYFLRKDEFVVDVLTNLLDKHFTEITFEQFKNSKHYKNIKQEKEIIGYKLINPEYLDACETLAKRFKDSYESSYSKSEPIKSGCWYTDKFKEAGVLDIWFKPVYAKSEKVISVGGKIEHLINTFIL